MRLYLKKILLLLSGGLTITLILLVLPSNHEDFSEDKIDPQLMPRLRRLNKKSSGSKNQPDVPPQTPYPQQDVGKAENVPYSRGMRTLDPKLVDMQQLLEKYGTKYQMFKAECKYNNTLGRYWKETYKRVLSKADSWERFYDHIGTCDMYRSDKVINDLLHDMATMPIKHVENMEGGTQVKLVITFRNGKKAVFKPMRFGRDYEVDPNHFYFSEYERHTAEIAAFHLDKVLSFRRAVPTVGRVINLTSEIQPIAEKKLAKTFFRSPADNLCFVSKCDYYCDTTHAICGSPDLKEGSFQAFLPDEDDVPRNHHRSTYKRTYSKRDKLAVWQKDMTFCSWKVKKKASYAHGRRLLDFIDLHIIDYLMSNQDRHHFEIFSVFEDHELYPILLDNGRGFGRPKWDDQDILLPLSQCCVIRPSTLHTLLSFYSGPESLSEALHKSLSNDPRAPILKVKHYEAIERRLEKVLAAVNKCIENAEDPDDVIMTDYHNPEVVREEEKKEKEDTVDPKERGNREKDHEGTNKR